MQVLHARVLWVVQCICARPPTPLSHLRVGLPLHITVCAAALLVVCTFPTLGGRVRGWEKWVGMNLCVLWEGSVRGGVQQN